MSVDIEATPDLLLLIQQRCSTNVFPLNLLTMTKRDRYRNRCYGLLRLAKYRVLVNDDSYQLRVTYYCLQTQNQRTLDA